MTILQMAQGSPEWFAARLGRLTGSRAADMLATIKKGESAARRNLRVQLVLERLTGESQASDYVSPDMERGTELEDEARRAYEARGQLVEQVGFCVHDDLMAGCSPDGFIGSDGLLEIKCPKSAQHLDYLKGDVPDEYRKQIIHNLWLTGRRWADFVSYDPRFPKHLRLKVTTIVPSAAEMTSYELAARLFLAEVDAEATAVAAMAMEAA